MFVLDPSSQVEGGALGGGGYFEWRVQGGNGFGYEQVEVGIGAGGVVVEGDEVFGPGQSRELYRVGHGGVTPADVLFVFGGAVLGVVDQEVNALCQLVAGRPVSVEGEALDAKRRLVVGEVGKAGGGTGDAVADGGAGVADESGGDDELPQGSIFAGDLVE